ncbi:rod shape-determining protein RodA [soil metagenome]
MNLPLLHRKPDSGLGNIRSSPADPTRNIDWTLLLTQGVLSVIGCFIVFSSSRNRVADDPFFYTTRQVIFTIVAAFVMFVVMSIDYEFWKERARVLYGATIISLVLLKLLSQASGQDLITFQLGPINLQPQEFAKVTVMIALAAYLSQERSEELSYPRFLGGLMVVGAPALLTLVQPDMGSAAMLAVLAMGVMLVAGAKPRYIALITFLSVVSVAAAFATRIVNEYQIERLRVFLDPDTLNPELADASYQVRNSIRAVGTGGMFGQGWLQGPLTAGGDIPVMWADFPFAAIAEEFGFVGSAAVLALYLVAILRIWRIMQLSRDLMGTYICAGVCTMLLFQVFQNVGMTVGIMPVTGLPLPFISYGGSGQLTWFIMFGLVQSVHMRRMR